MTPARRAVLFVDPGPGGAQYLAAVGAALAPDYRAIFFALRPKSRSLLRRLGQTLLPAHTGGRAPWPDDGAIDPATLRGHLRKDADRAAVAARAPHIGWLIATLAETLDRLQPAAVFLWNGSGLAPALAAQLARARAIPTLFAENGYLPNTLQLDPEGVNAFASFARTLDPHALRDRPEQGDCGRALEQVLADYRAAHPVPRQAPPGGRLRPAPWAYLRQALVDLRERPPRRRRAINRLIPRRLEALPERFVLFPLQVRTDSQLTIHSPLYGNRLDEAITEVRAALRSIAPDTRLLIKLHPADLDKTDYDPLARACPDLLWLAGGDVRDLLVCARCVVTVNSTVGVEALIFARPVVALGHNFYVHDGLVHPVRTRAQLATQLQRALTEPPDLDLIGRFLRHLYCERSVHAHKRDFSPASIGNLARAIKTQIALRAKTITKT